MRTVLRRFLTLTTLGVMASAIAAAGVSAAPPGSGLTDISHRLSALQTQLGAFGGTTRTGQLSQLANCGYGPTSQEFLAWGDPAKYNLAPGGDLASTDGWTLKDASFDSGHDPYSAAAGSLVLSGGNPTAESPAACVNLFRPTMRFFLSHSGPRHYSALDVYVVYQGLDGNSHTLTLASLTAGDSWQPSLTIPIGVNFLSTASIFGWTPVSFGFTAHGLLPGESYSIDGIYVDPCWSR